MFEIQKTTQTKTLKYAYLVLTFEHLWAISADISELIMLRCKARWNQIQAKRHQAYLRVRT